MSKAAAKTGIGPIALVAVEQYFPEGQRVINDSLAYRMLPASAKIFVRLMKAGWMRDWIIALSDKSQPGIWGGLLCRKRYIDDKLIASGKDVEAVVNLGAGFDTRVYRIPSFSSVEVWEIDHQENIRAKEARLRKVFGTVPANVRLVPIDFDRENFDAALESQGYSTNKRTFFIMEAVTQYLTKQGVKEVFDFLEKASPGSWLVFTYVRRDFLEGKNFYGWESGYKRFVAGKVWHSGMDPETLPGFLINYGWKLTEDRGYDELAGEYLKPSGRKLNSTPLERMVYAEKF